MSNGLLIILKDPYSCLPDCKFKEINDELNKANCKIYIQNVNEYIHNLGLKYYSRNDLFNICIMNSHEDEIISSFYCVNPYALPVRKICSTEMSSLYCIIEKSKEIIKEYTNNDTYNKLMIILSMHKYRIDVE